MLQGPHLAILGISLGTIGPDGSLRQKQPTDELQIFRKPSCAFSLLSLARTLKEVCPQKAVLDDLTLSAAASGDLIQVPQSWALPFLSVALPSLSPITFTQIPLPSQEAI
jgi:hypothetical protein